MPDELCNPGDDEEKSVRYVNIVMSKMTPANIFAGKYAPLTDITAHKGVLPRLKATSLETPDRSKVQANPAVAVYRSLPRQLSKWGFFKGAMKDQQPASNVVPYALNTPLYSDDTEKFRYIKLPKGTTMSYDEKHVFDFPVGTAIAKTFAYPDDLQRPNDNIRLLETRIEFRRESGWYGATYLWNEEQADAELSLGGGEMNVTFTNHDGKRIEHKYFEPNANQCLLCHSEDGNYVPIGPNARNLNRDGLSNWHGQNQLRGWTTAGILKGTPPAKSLPELPDYQDRQTGSNSERARAWLDVNCAHCHNPKGSARTLGLDLSYTQNDPAKYGVLKSPIAAGRATAGRKFDIVPGKPDKSILLYRIESNEPGVRMPSLGRGLTRDRAVELVRDWIASMPAATEQGEVD